MLTEHQQNILDIFLEEPDRPLATSNLLPQLNIERTTLYRDLTAMVNAGWRGVGNIDLRGSKATVLL